MIHHSTNNGMAAAMATYNFQKELYEKTALGYINKYSAKVAAKELSATAKLGELKKSLDKIDDCYSGIRKLSSSTNAVTSIFLEQKKHFEDKTGLMSTLAMLNQRASRNPYSELHSAATFINLQSEIINNLAITFAKIEGLTPLKSKNQVYKLNKLIPKIASEIPVVEFDLDPNQLSEKVDQIISELRTIKIQTEITSESTANDQTIESKVLTFDVEKKFQLFVTQQLLKQGCSEELALWFGNIVIKIGMYFLFAVLGILTVDQCESDSSNKLLEEVKQIHQEISNQNHQQHAHN